MDSDKIPPQQKKTKMPVSTTGANPPKSQFENMAISLQSTFKQHPVSGPVGIKPAGAREDGIEFLSKKDRTPSPVPGFAGGAATPITPSREQATVSFPADECMGQSAASRQPNIQPSETPYPAHPTLAIPENEYQGQPMASYPAQPTLVVPENEYLGQPMASYPAQPTLAISENEYLGQPITPQPNITPPTGHLPSSRPTTVTVPGSEDLGTWEKPQKSQDPFGLLNTTLQGKYEITGFIGKGGMGAVYLARHKLLGKQRAIKTLQKSANVDPALVKRFFIEARAAAAVEHPNIVQVHDIDETDTFYFIVMEYVNGESLEVRMRRSGALPLKEAIHVVKGAALGLTAIHKAGMVHRDIKPGNLLLNTDGEIKITDFGIVKEIGGDTQLTGTTIIGTPQFMAPEQITRESIDCRTDMYSLGTTFYFLITNRHCFTGSTVQLIYQIVHENPIPPHRINSHIDPKISDIILKMMTKNPNNRYQNLNEVYEVLREF